MIIRPKKFLASCCFCKLNALLHIHRKFWVAQAICVLLLFGCSGHDGMEIFHQRQDVPPTSPIRGTTLRIAFHGANGGFELFDGRGMIDVGADRAFGAMSYDEASDYIAAHFKDCQPPYDLRIVGYSWGGWTALILAHDLGPDYRIRIALVDPV